MKRPAWKTSALRTAALIGPILLILDAVLPAQVFCHRLDGRTAIERDAGPGACSCRECEECLAAREAAPAGPESAPALKSCHCRHETVYSETGLSLVQERPKKWPAGAQSADADSPAVPEPAAPSVRPAPSLECRSGPSPDACSRQVLRL